MVMQKFLFYALQSVEQILKSKVRKAGIPTLDSRDIERLPIPLPPLSEQERIVGILDRFEALAHSMSEGLPREIALRRQQYEHYRRELLDFARPQS